MVQDKLGKSVIRKTRQDRTGQGQNQEKMKWIYRNQTEDLFRLESKFFSESIRHLSRRIFTVFTSYWRQGQGDAIVSFVL